MKSDSQENLLPTIFVIFGATGDLTKQKLVPALFHLYREDVLPDMFQIAGFARQDLSDSTFQEYIAGIVKEKVKDATFEDIQKFSAYFVYQQGMFQEIEGFKKLAARLGQKDGEWKVCANKLFHLAVPPQFYKELFEKLKKSGLTKPCSPEEGWTRVLVEKPFGKDRKTAQELDVLLGKLFQEEQIYRIDHYLGKETVQNVLAFRFSNSFLAPVWDNKGIEKIEVRLLEKKGIEKRAGFYEGIGALRDVGQNHVLQLLALFLMENPGTFDADSIREERAKIFQSLQTPSKSDIEKMTIRGQYQGYTEEDGVDKLSETETYFRIKTHSTDKKWKGVPLYLESGKALDQEKVEVIVTFRHSDQCLCPKGADHYKNVLYYQVQPREGATISFWVKKPGAEMVLEEKEFSFDYKKAFEGEEFSDAYERLMANVIKGDQTLFVSTEEILAGWKFVDHILKGWREGRSPLVTYERGSEEITTKVLADDNS